MKKIIISLFIGIALFSAIYLINITTNHLNKFSFKDAVCIEHEKTNYVFNVCKTLCDNSTLHNLYSMFPIFRETQTSLHLFESNITCETAKDYFEVNRYFGGGLKIGMDCYQDITEIESSSRCKIYQNSHGLMANKTTAEKLGLKWSK